MVQVSPAQTLLVQTDRFGAPLEMQPFAFAKLLEGQVCATEHVLAHSCIGDYPSGLQL